MREKKELPSPFFKTTIINDFQTEFSVDLWILCIGDDDRRLTIDDPVRTSDQKKKIACFDDEMMIRNNNDV